MDSLGSPDSIPPVPGIRDRALHVIAAATLLAMLYFARDVLVPITLAFILSLLVAPLVRALKHLNFGHTGSVLTAVLILAAGFGMVGAIIGGQLFRMADSFPQYEKTIDRKLETLNRLTVRRVNAFTGQASRSLNRRVEDEPARTLTPATTDAQGAAAQGAAAPGAAAPGARAPAGAALSATAQPASTLQPIPVELHEAPANPLQLIQRVLQSIWVPIETAGIVLVVLVFVLLEQEALRDRFIRIAGGTDIRLTTLAINDAGERLSRFFVSQFAVNLGVGITVWIGLSIIGLPHPVLWAALTGVLRFVPYVGVWIAALCAALLAAAVDSGWGLAFTTLGLFLIVELIAGQLVEPQLYGHTTGLSPLSVVIAAIFWSWLWGPIGLIVSTPLTLCLLVAGRHIKALNLLDVLLGDTQALTMPQRFYQRALSADSDEIIAGARDFLKRNSFANYCDLVLMPALHLARLDLRAGAISVDQQTKVRSAMIAVIAAIGGESRRMSRRNQRSSVLDKSVGRQLRLQREQVSGRWQGPLTVPPGSVIVCVGLGSIADELATELLVRILREQKIDARHMSLEDDLSAVPLPNAEQAVSMVYVVSAFPSEERTHGDETADDMRHRFPHACIVSVFLPGMLLQPETAAEAVTMKGADKSASSLAHAVQICLDMHPESHAA